MAGEGHLGLVINFNSLTNFRGDIGTIVGALPVRQFCLRIQHNTLSIEHYHQCRSPLKVQI